MIERDKPTAPPRYGRAYRAAEFETMWHDLFEGGQGFRTQCDDHARPQYVKLTDQVCQAVGAFLTGGWTVAPIAILWIAQDRVGDKDMVTGPPGSCEQVGKISPCLVCRERNATAFGTKSAGRFRDKRDECGRCVAICMAQYPSASLHRGARAALLHLGYDLVKCYSGVDDVLILMYRCVLVDGASPCLEPATRVSAVSVPLLP